MSKEKRKAIIVDIDGTLANIDHRRHLVTGESNHWDEFFKLMVSDSVNEWCKTLIEHMSRGNERHWDSGFRILLVTGRPSNFEKQTIDWLNKSSVYFDFLFMRREGDSRKDAVVKSDIYFNSIRPNFDVLFVVDDRQQVVDMWRSLGLTTLQCDKGDY